MTSSGVKNVMINRPPRAKKELTDAEVEAFGSQEFVQQALASPSDFKHVLSFFFGEDYSHERLTEAMRSGNCLQSMPKLWFQQNTIYDKFCARFTNLIRDAGKKQLKGSEWNDTVNGRVAQMILCDQFARNAFRATKEAYDYDGIAQEIARGLAQSLVSSAPVLPENPLMGPPIDGLDGEVYPPYLAFILVSLMHSEKLDDHNLCDQLFHRTIETTQPHLQVYFEGEQKVAQEHREVLETFGRYPHRNALLERETTPEEAAWLARTEELPDWAKVH